MAGYFHTQSTGIDKFLELFLISTLKFENVLLLFFWVGGGGSLLLSICDQVSSFGGY